MKAAIFTPVPYMGPAPRGSWPVPTSSFSVEVAEHHLAPMSLTPG